MDETQEELKPLTSIQLLDAAIWREIGSDQPQRQKPYGRAFPSPRSLDAYPFPSS